MFCWGQFGVFRVCIHYILLFTSCACHLFNVHLCVVVHLMCCFFLQAFISVYYAVVLLASLRVLLVCLSIWPLWAHNLKTKKKDVEKSKLV